MAQVSYPGVYIEEVPSGVRAIAGVSTSIAAFVDRFRRGTTTEAVEIFSMGDFEREFGGLDPNSPASYAIAQFFLNGGTHAWVVRVLPTGATSATVKIKDTDGDSLIVISAKGEGTWANGNVRVRIGAQRLDGTFDTTIAEYRGASTRPLVVERYRTEDTAQLIQEINDRSSLVTAELIAGADGTQLPAPNGMWVDLPRLTTAPSAPIANGATFTLQVHAPGRDMVPLTAKLEWTPSTAPTTTAGLAMRVEEAIRKAAANDGKLSMVGATLRAENGKWFLRPGGGDYVAEMRVLAVAGDAVANALGLATSAGDDVRSNPQEYVLGTAHSIGAQVAGVPGVDGSDLTGVQIVGEEGSKTGMYRLLDVDLFNILCIPAAADLAEASYVYDRAAALCVARRAFLIIDPPTTTVTLEQAKALPGIIERNPNAAVYFPRVEVLDPLNNFAPKSIGASGTMAGIFARTDAERGVWHAPAGVDAVLRGVHDLDVKLTDPENGVLNKLAVNCLRGFPVQGRIAWGARTLEGPDDNATEWKYVPIRRLALMIEESLYRGTKWAVFQPNDEPLWARLRQNVGAYMHRLFRQHAFQGATPREAYYVKCDREINPPTDRELGIVTVEVGFAPLKPAEFVVLRIQQIAEIA